MMYTYMPRHPRPEMAFEHLFREMTGMPPRSAHRLPRMFPVDVKKEEGAFILTAELPGVKLEDISILLEDDVLTIRAEAKLHKREERGGYVICERRGGCMERRFVLEGIRQEEIKADCADGVLTVVLPKEVSADGKGPRRIAIGSAPAELPDAPEVPMLHVPDEE